MIEEMTPFFETFVVSPSALAWILVDRLPSAFDALVISALSPFALVVILVDRLVTSPCVAIPELLALVPTFVDADSKKSPVSMSQEFFPA